MRASRDRYQGTRWMMPVRMSRAASKLTKTAQTSRDNDQGFFLTVVFVSLIGISSTEIMKLTFLRNFRVLLDRLR